MNYDIPKLPSQQSQYVVERSIISTSPVPKRKKNPFKESSHEAENFGGLFVTANGTANASIVSPSAPPDEYIYFIPESDLPLPEVEMERQHMANNMEKSTEIRLKS